MERNSFSSSLKAQKFYSCQRCLNHNQIAARKDHKKICPFANCSCSKCELVEKRRLLNARLAKVKSMDPDKSTDINMDDNNTINVNNASHINMYSKDNPVNVNKHENNMNHNINMNTQNNSNTSTERLPHCQRCAQHNVQNRLKGHKKECIFKDCQCAKCKVVTERQRLMADQIKLRRRQRKQKIEFQNSFSSTSDSPTSSFSDNSVFEKFSNFQTSGTVMPPTISAFPPLLSIPHAMNNFQLFLSLCALQQQLHSNQLQNPLQNLYLTTESSGIWHPIQ